MEGADAIAKAGSPACGDMITFYLKVDGDAISAISFESYGCAANIGTASYLTELVKGKPLKEAWNVNWKRLSDDLGGLPKVKFHCGILAVGALRRTIREYYISLKTSPSWLPRDLTEEEKGALEEEEMVEKIETKLQK
jgi:nitrogen fixation NifU-like protein